MSNEKRQLSQYSDDEVLELWEKCGQNASQAARECGCGPSTFRERVRLIQDESYQESKARGEAAQFIVEELEARGIDPREVKVGKATVKTEKKRYQAFHKDEKGEAVVTPLKSDNRLVSITFSPKFADGPKWPLIEPAAQAPIKYISQSTVESKTNARKVFFWPDTQIGFYRSVFNNELTPFHDVRAIEVALQMLKQFKPDEVVILGDFLDLPSMSRWLQIPEFQHTMQPSIQYAYNILAKIRSIVGSKSKIVFIHGNHERRLSEYVAKNAMAALGVRAACTNPEDIDPVTLAPKKWDWPQLSIYKLLNFEQLNIECMAEYPGGQYWITDKLVAVHALPSSTTDIRATLVGGHEMTEKKETRTIHYRDRTEEYSRIVIPGLMRTDDITDMVQLSRTAVPSSRARFNAQQAVGTAVIFADDLFDVRVHRIKDGRGIFQDKLITANL